MSARPMPLTTKRFAAWHTSVDVIAQRTIRNTAAQCAAYASRVGDEHGAEAAVVMRDYEAALRRAAVTLADADYHARGLLEILESTSTPPLHTTTTNPGVVA